MSRNKDFFKTLKPHSEAKLKIFETYVIPWMRKIVLGSSKKCLLIDGFAGSGIYNDGNLGSPIRLIDQSFDFTNQAASNGWTLPEILLIFIEKNDNIFKKLCLNISQRYEHLGSLLKDSEGWFYFESYPKVRIMLIEGEFKNVFKSLLDKVNTLVPTLAFVDPFGFKDTPMDLFHQYSRHNGCEMVINFIYEETNRFLSHSSNVIRNYIHELFGIKDSTSYDKWVHSLKDLSPREREKIVLKFYSDRLENSFEYVRQFRLISESNRLKTVLFHATNNINGLITMKEAMWKIDNTGSYTYNPATRLFELDIFNSLKTKVGISALSELIYEEFKGKKNIIKRDKHYNSEIDFFVAVSTIYCSSHVKSALKLLEEKGRIANIRKINGGKRYRKTYKDVLIDFV